MPERKSLFLVDGSALAYRSYFAFIKNPLINSKGENTSAVFGFTKFILNLLKNQKPDYLAIAFDTGKPTFRHEEYKLYKATRQKMPDELRSQVERIKQVVEALRIPLIELEGYEADDLIGTLTGKSVKVDLETVIVAADKDLMQLVSPTVKILNPTRGKEKEIEIIDEKGVGERFGVKPTQIADVLALMGDTSDNVPGVPGVGEKTAVSLIQKYGDLETVLAKAEEIPQKKLSETLLQHIAQARLSKRLVTIEMNVPIDLDLENLKVEELDYDAVTRLFRELEFNKLLQEISRSESVTPKKKEYITVREEDIDALIAKLESHKAMAIDTETTSTDPMRAELVGISISVTSGEAFYIPIGHTDGLNLEKEKVLSKLRPVLESNDIRKFGQNVKYDTIVLSRCGIEPRGFEFDTMIASYLINPAGQHSLDSLSLEYLNHNMIPISQLIGTGKNQRSFAKVSIKEATEYSCEDADITLQLKTLLEPKLKELSLEELFQKVEMPLVEVLRLMEMTGVCVDLGFLKKMSEELQEELNHLQDQIYKDAGEEFNINSTQQLAKILFEKLKLPSRKKTKTGFSTDVSVLEELAREHELPRLLLEYRQLSKLKSTYVDAFPELINPETGRIHTSFNQTVTSTGRLSSSEPNLQNIPIRTEVGRKIRRAFIPADDSWLILDADYSQIELRLMAHISQDKGLMEAFCNDEDIHTRTASLIFGLFPEFITPDLRRQAKTVNFGIIYGIGAYGLSQQLDISVQEAQRFIDSYFVTYPGVKEYMDRTIEQARRDGYVTTILGRRRYLPEINSDNKNVREFAERTAINTPIQGSAADMIKIAMININHSLRERKMEAKMILQVHDELVFEVSQEEVEEAKELIVHEMENALELSIPIKADVGIGTNWLEAH